MKTCSKCGETKPRSGFGKRTASRDGHHPWCQSCKLGYEKQYRRSNPGVIAAKNRRFRDAEKQREREALERVRASRN